MNVQNIPIIKVNPYARNARTHSQEQIAQIAASIKEFGFNNPKLIDSENVIIAGHGRLEAARMLVMDKVPSVCLDHMRENQKRAYILADNKMALNAGWDDEMIRLEFEALMEFGFDIDLTGFDGEFVDDLLKNADEVGFPELASGDKEPFQQITFTLHDEQADIIEEALRVARSRQEIDTGLNENRNGNAIAHIADQWLRINGNG